MEASQKQEKNVTPGMLHSIPCDLCKENDFHPLFEKESSRGAVFQIVRCKNCGLVQVNPQPDLDMVRPYYQSEYFSRRTDRGYDNYFSENLKTQINSVYNMNLEDLGFDDMETELGVRKKNISRIPRSLDVGCAAGYFVEHMKNRGWDSTGIEISEEAAAFGIQELGLHIIVDDFLSCDKLLPGSFEMVTLWASLEHMHSPMKVLERSFELLKPGGRMVLSTCRYGLIAMFRGKKWRYMNVPEHLYFFSLSGLKKAVKKAGFRVVRSVTYGSGFTTDTEAGPIYRVAKKIFDPAVKKLGQGDMMAIHLMKPFS